jgi:hypothetical protein
VFALTDPLQNQFLQLFLVYGVPLLVTGLAALVSWLLVRRAQWWAQAGKSGAIWDGMKIAEELASKAVAAAITELQGEYRKLVADGNLSQDDVVQLRTKAWLILKEKLGTSGLAFLDRSLKNLGLNGEAFLNTQVSAAISRLAGQDPSVALSAPVVAPAPSRP